MFQLVATIAFLMNGQPVEGTVQIPSNVKFPSMESCVAMKDSDAHTAALGRLDEQVTLARPGLAHTITAACEKFDNGSI